MERTLIKKCVIIHHCKFKNSDFSLQISRTKHGIDSFNVGPLRKKKLAGNEKTHDPDHLFFLARHLRHTTSPRRTSNKETQVRRWRWLGIV